MWYQSKNKCISNYYNKRCTRIIAGKHEKKTQIEKTITWNRGVTFAKYNIRIICPCDKVVCTPCNSEGNRFEHEPLPVTIDLELWPEYVCDSLNSNKVKFQCHSCLLIDDKRKLQQLQLVMTIPQLFVIK
jgi:hypothetical protein